MAASTTLYLSLMPWGFGAVGAIAVANAAFNGLERPLPALAVSLARTLAVGVPAAWAAARAGVPAVIHEMRPQVGTFAHRTGDLAEMVCSNSFRSDDDEQNAVGLLHWDMRAAGSIVMDMAARHRLIRLLFSEPPHNIAHRGLPGTAIVQLLRRAFTG